MELSAGSSVREDWRAPGQATKLAPGGADSSQPTLDGNEMTDQTDLSVKRVARVQVPEVVQSNPRVIALRSTEVALERAVRLLTAEVAEGLAAGHDERSDWFLATRAKRKTARQELETARAMRRKAERELMAEAAGAMKEQGAKIQEICAELGVPAHTARSLTVAAKSLREASASEDAMLRLPVRHRNRLLAEGIRSLADVGDAIANGSLDKVPNLGRRSIEDIREWYSGETARDQVDLENSHAACQLVLAYAGRLGSDKALHFYPPQQPIRRHAA